MKPRLLCILHRSPPAHGAAKVGDFIAQSKKLQESFDCKFITIKSSETISDIGKVSFKKLYLVAELYLKVLFALIFFRPSKIYFTASVKGVAFYRDILLSTLWKTYKIFKKVDIYYHYHTKGVNDFVSSSNMKLQFTGFFLKDVNVILLSSLLMKDFGKVQTYKQILYLSNGVENNFTDIEFENYVEKKKYDNINVLYLSNMIKSKGYFEVLKLAKQTKDKNYHYHFAGGWQNEKEEKDFFEFIEENGLKSIITFHGFVDGKKKKELLKNSHILIFPTRYELESFGLVIIEAFSYGLPVISTDEGSLPFIINDKSGIVVNNLNDLPKALENMIENFMNIKTARYCRKRYLKNFSLEQFEEKLVKIFMEL